MAVESLPLHCREYGNYRDQRPTLILLHGLFGSSSNWAGIARALAAEHHLLLPDLRNHGRSPHHPRMDYPAMAADVARLIDDQGLDSALLIGHSMGGKCAMWLALQQSERVAGLVVVDIAPVSYRHGFDTILDALQGLDLEQLASREQALSMLAERLPEAGLRHYLLQNLLHSGGRWQWRIDLSLLRQVMPALTGFPDISGAVYPGPSHFIHGSESDYLQADHHPIIRQHFPLARIRTLSGAGHWLYSEQPDAFLAALRVAL